MSTLRVYKIQVKSKAIKMNVETHEDYKRVVFGT